MVSDSGWSAIAWVALAALSFASSAIIFRHTGQEAYGVWATIAALRGLVTFLDGGLALGVARDAARAVVDIHEARARIAAARRLYLVLGIAGSAVGVAASDVPGSILGLEGAARAAARIVTVLVAVDTGLALAMSPYAAILRGRREFRVLAFGSVAQAVIGTALVIVLTPHFGLVGSAGALLAARLAPSVAYVWRLQSSHRHLLRGGPGGAHRSVLRFATPVWIIALGTQIGLGTDVPIVGAVYGASTASAYALGSLLAATAAGLLYVVIDATFPRLAAAASGALEQQLPRLMLGGTTLGMLGFATLALTGEAVVDSWVGTAPTLSLQVLWIYAAARMLNVPTHILSIAAIARDRHTVLAPIVIGEAVASLLMSIILATLWNPLGPAVGTLATIVVSNVVVIPAILLRRLGVPWAAAAIPALAGMLVGLVLALLIRPLAATQTEPVAEAIAAVVLAGATGVAVTTAMMLGAQRRVWRLIRHGGAAVVARELVENIVARRRLRSTRSAPTIWSQSDPPLVSIRIATYNRGRLVAERAIASALRQTHRNIEVVVVGDHCDAETERAVRSVDDPRVRFENLAARGQYPTNSEHKWMVAGTVPMNHALDLVRGQWIAPLDDDDEFTEDHVEVLLDACRTSNAELAYGIAEMEVPGSGWVQVGSWPPRRGQIIHAAVLYSSTLRFFKHNVDSWRIGEPADWNMWRRMRNAGVRMHFVPRVVCRHYAERREVGRSPSSVP